MLENRDRTVIAVATRSRRWIAALALLLLWVGAPAWAQVTCFWNQNGAGQWDNPSNWNGCAGGNGNPADTPGPADHAVIGNIAPLADVDVGASARNVDRLTLSAGRIFGDADITVTSALNWTGGTIDGGGAATQLLLDSASISEIGGIALHVLAKRDLRILGAVTWVEGDIELFEDAEIDNQGQFIVDFSGGVRGGGFALQLRSDGSPLARIHNASGAGIEKLGDQTASFNVAFDNGGDVQVNDGTLQVNGPGGDFGAYQVAPIARLEFGFGFGTTRTLSGSSAISGSGTVHKFNEGTLEITGGYALTGTTEVVDGVLFMDTPANPLSLPSVRVRAPGILSSPGNLIVTGTLDWEGGEIVGTAGELTLTLPVSAVATISLDDLRPAAFLRSRNLVNLGSVTLAASASTLTHLWLDAASIDNRASFTIDNNSAANQNLRLDCLSTNCGSFFNRAGATLTLIDQQGIVAIGNDLAAFNNAGVVELTQGCGAIGAPGTDTGTYRYAGACTLALSPRPDSTRALESSVVLDPIAGTSLQLGGSVRINGASRSFGNLIIDPAATLFGPAAFTFSGFTIWRGLIEGTSPGESSATVAPGATLQTSGNPADSPLLFARRLFNDGDINISDVRVRLDGNAEIRNNNLLNLQGSPAAAGAIGCATPPLCGLLTNTSTGSIQSIAFPAGAATQLEADITVVNQGALRVDNGVMILESPYTAASGSLVEVFPGAGLRRQLSPLALAAGTLRGAGVIDADVDADLVVIQPGGGATANLAVLGSFSATANTVFEMGIAGTMPPALPKIGERASMPAGIPSYDRVTIAGGAALNNATLNVIDLAYPASGSDVFDLMLYASRSGDVVAGANPYSVVGLTLQTQATRIRLAAPGGAVVCNWNLAGVGADVWSNPAKWDNCGGGVPGASDTAVVGAGTVELDSPVSVGSLEFTGGTILGANDLSIITELTWTGGRFQGVSGNLVTTTSTTLVTVAGGQHTIDGRTFVLNSSAAWTTGLIELANGGVLEISSTGTLNSNPSLNFESIFGSGIGVAEVRNEGAIVKTGPNFSGIGQSVQYSGAGSIQVNSGDFVFAASSATALDGSYTALSGATLQFVGGNRSFAASATLDGGNLVFGDSGPVGINTVGACIGSASTVIVRNAELVLNCASPSDLDGLLMTEPFAVLEGSSAIRVTGNFGWGHGTIRGTGLGQTFEIAPAAVAQFEAPLGPSLPRILSNRRLRNDGTIDWIGANATEINDGAQFANELGAQLILRGGGSRNVASNAPTTSQLVNNGTLSVQEGALGDVDVAFDNFGSVQLIDGELRVRRDGNDVGTYGVEAGSLLYFDGAARTQGPGSAVSGDGGVRVIGSAAVTTNGTFQPHDLRIESSGVVRIDSASPQLIQTLLLQSGTLTGNAEVRIGTFFDWRNGGVLASVGATPGPVVIQSGALLDMCFGICTLSDRVLRIEGIADWGGGAVEVPAGAAGKIVVATGGTLQTTNFKSAARYRCSAPTCTAEMEIEGSLLQIGDGAELQLSSPLLINGGTLRIDQFDLLAPGVTLSGGLIEIRNNASLTADPVLLNGGILRADGQINGNVDNVAARVQPGASPGQIDIFGSYTQGPSGILDIEVGGLSPGIDSDFIFTGGTANLDGIVNIIDGGHTLTAPQTLDFLNADSGLSGTFAVTNIAFPGYDVTYSANTATLTPTGGPLVVNSVGDAGDGICDAGECTLRDALITANLMPDPDVIEFNIPEPQCTGPGAVCVIAPTSPLPAITGPVLVDGYSQPGASPNLHPQSLGLGSNAALRIELDGVLTSASPGLVVNAPGASVVVAGLSIYRFGAGIVSAGPGDALYQILGNFVGLRADGSAAPGGQLVGVSVQGGNTRVGDGTAFGMNVISGNTQQGISIQSIPALASLLVQGNLIGTAPNGLAALGNGLQGIGANTASAIAGIFIGGSLPDERNVISGNLQDGIRFQCTATSGNCFDGARVLGNFIGPAADGSALGNLGNGVNLSAMDDGLVRIGGINPGEGNRIAFNGGNGILATFGGIGRASFVRNDIYLNGQLGIDLGGDGRTGNDVGDADVGPNGRLNFPTFSSYTAPGGTSAVIDVVLGTPDIGGNYPARVDFYRATEDEPSVWLGTTSCVAPGVNCPASFAFPGGVTVAPDDIVLGIVTDNFGKSSEASFYATTTTVSAPDATIGSQYTATVEVAVAEPFTALGTVDVDDGAGQTCAATLSEIGPGLSGGSCQLDALAPPGSRTLTASYAPETPPARPFSNSSGNDTVLISAAAMPPVLTQISASSGPPGGGNVVNLTGSNFVIGSTAVAFGAVQAAVVNCTSATACTATVPPGSGTVNVRVTTVDGTSVDTPADDYTYVAATACANFAAPAFFATGSQPRDLALGDFNGDGHRDLAVVNSVSIGSISVLLGDGAGAFAAAVDYPVGAFPRALAVGDFNGDDNQDLVVANYGATHVSILLGTGSGTFGGATAVSAGLGPHGVAVGDFNADGRADLAVVLLDADSVAILLGNGDGTFGAPALSGGLRSVAVGVGDFDRDGRSDFAVGNVALNSASVLLGAGAGSFGAASQYAVGSNPRDLAIADFNNDGISDLAVANRGSDNLSVLLGAGDGTFAPATSHPVGTQPGGIDAGDFDGDGDIDLAVANAGSSNVSLLLGTGAGAFGAPGNFSVGDGPSSVAFADFNGDGRIDIATSNEFTNSVAILGSLGCAPAITSISPSSGPEAGATVVTLNGTDFAIGATSVSFGATPATAVNCTTTSLCEATSPAGAGVVSVSATTVAGTSADTAADDFTYIPAAPPIVNSTADPGNGTCDLAECTLREAIALANSTLAPDVSFDPAVFNVPRTIILTAGELVSTQNLGIVGPAALLVISGNNASRVLYASGVDLTLSNLALTGGNSTGSDRPGVGGAILHSFGNLTLTDVVLGSNSCSATGTGGALAVTFGTLAATRVSVTGNTCNNVGGIYLQDGNLTLVDSSLTGNSGTEGEALRLVASVAPRPTSVRGFGSAQLTNVTISGNSTSSANSAIRVEPLTGTSLSLTLTNVTVSGNTTTAAGGNGALWHRPSGGTHVTVLHNTIASGNLVGGVANDIEGTLDAGSSFNVIGVGGGLSNGINGNQIGINDPLLASLSDYGGGTLTRALLPGSPAINAGSNGLATNADQRGVSRPQQGTVDVGAFESQGFVLSLVSGTPQTTPVNSAFALPLVVGVAPNFAGEPVDGGRVTYSAPGAGASATLSGPATISGSQASATATANAIVGSYSVTAAASGSSATPGFALTNGVQATATTITGIAPAASVVGQPYLVTVGVSDGVSAVVVGIVEVRQLSDGSVCTIDLASASSCQLVANTALTTAVRATYLGAGSFAPSQSATVAHVVGRAGTAIAIVGDTPDPSPVGAPVTVTVDLDVLAPGAGVPSGEILVTDGIASCGITLPNLSCQLLAKAVGPALLEARYLGDANFEASLDTEPHLFAADGADLAIIKRNGLRLVPGGQPSTYVLLVTNAGPQDVVNARVTDILPPQFSAASWTCSAGSGASCPAAGSGTVDTLVNLAAGSSVTFALTATAQIAPEQVVTNIATVTPPANAPDPVPDNNQSIDVDEIGVFGDGFETEDE